MNPNQQEPIPQPNIPEVPMNYEVPANIENKNIAPIPASQEKPPSPPVIQSAPQALPIGANQATPSSNIQTPGNDLIADDGDLIEKEWVDRAKTVVDKTKDNPHEQNKEMNEVKKDYLKKRYNKDLVVEDE